MPENSLKIDYLKKLTVPIGVYTKLGLVLSDYQGLDVNFLRSEFPGNRIVEAIIKK